jgi:opacity protein-like surface antigen
MKHQLVIFALFFCTISSFGQSADYKFGITAGAPILQYNGNLGNSFFKFNSTCFGGVGVTLGMKLNKSFDINIGGFIGDFGYCQTDADKNRIVAVGLRCPGCKDRLGMGDLSSRMYSANVGVKYKFANDYLLKENSKFSPYVLLGMGLNYLEDNMKVNCVNVGYHLTINAGTGIKYTITERFNIGYNLGVGCFIGDKVYATAGTAADTKDNDADALRMQRRKDFCMQNALIFGMNF